MVLLLKIIISQFVILLFHYTVGYLGMTEISSSTITLTISTAFCSLLLRSAVSCWHCSSSFFSFASFSIIWRSSVPSSLSNLAEMEKEPKETLLNSSEVYSVLETSLRTL